MDVRDELDWLFGSGDLQVLRRRALDGQFRRSLVRSIVWKQFLGVLPQRYDLDEWASVMTRQRLHYDALQEEHMRDPRADPKVDVSINNPLSQEEESPWTQFYQNIELETQIRRDLERTFPEYRFFASQAVQDLMCRILFVWARMHPTIGYRQGMHELLAPFVYIIDKEKLKRLEGDHDPLVIVTDSNFVEHDSFLLFAKVMEVMKEEYAPPHKKNDPAPEPRRGSVLSARAPISNSSVYRCQRVHRILKNMDPALHAHLEGEGIEPQLYNLRWVRLLLVREFHLEDVLTIWDATFTDPHDFALLEYICVAMLIYIRGHLLDKDMMGCLRRLQKYPPVEDVSVLVQKAVQLRQRRERGNPTLLATQTLPPPPPFSPTSGSLESIPVTTAQKSPVEDYDDNEGPLNDLSFRAPSTISRPSEVASTPPFDPLGVVFVEEGGQAQKGIQRSQSDTLKVGRSFRSQMKQGSRDRSENREVEKMRADVDSLRTVQKHTAERLEKIIGMLQKELVDRLAPSSSFNADVVNVALAELRQVQHILVLSENAHEHALAAIGTTREEARTAGSSP